MVIISNRTTNKLDSVELVDVGQTRLEHGEAVSAHALRPARLERSFVPVHVVEALAAMSVVEDAMFGHQKRLALERTNCACVKAREIQYIKPINRLSHVLSCGFK